MGWAGIVAIWAHFVCLLVVGSSFRSTPSDVRYVEIVRVASPGSTPGQGQGSTAPREEVLDGAAPGLVGVADGTASAVAPKERQLPEPALVRVAHTNAKEAVAEAPLRTDAESARNTEALTASRAPVTSDRPGLPTPVQDGVTDLSAGHTLERRDGDWSSAMGNRADGVVGPVAVGGGDGGGGPQRVVAPALGEGTPGEAGQAGGEPGRRGGSPSAVAGGASAGGYQPPSVTAPDGPDPTSRPSVAGPAWWVPTVQRVHSVATPAAAPTPNAPEPVVVAAAPVYMAVKAARPTGSGGTRAMMAVSTPPPDPVPLPPSRRRIAAPGTADPIVELREALGFGPLDRSVLSPRPEWAGQLFEQGAAHSSPQTALDVPIAWRTALSTRGTPLGKYVESVESVIAGRWQGTDLDPHARAFGVQGDVTVRYVVSPDGRTRDLAVVSSSGNRELDALALSAIPERLQRFPRELPRQPIHHELTLRYRNPLVGP